MLYLFLVAKMEAMPKFTLFARLFFICFCFEVITMESMFKVRMGNIPRECGNIWEYAGIYTYPYSQSAKYPHTHIPKVLNTQGISGIFGNMMLQERQTSSTSWHSLSIPNSSR